MLGYLVGGFLRLLFRVWTFGLFYFLENRLFLWIKGIATPRLSYKKIKPFDEEIIPRNRYKGLDSRICILDPSYHYWNSIFFSSLITSKKLPFVWIAKTMMFPSRSSEQTFNLTKSYRLNNSSQGLWNSQSVSMTQIMRDKNFKTDSMFENSCSAFSKEILPSYFNKKKNNMDLVEHCIFKDLYSAIIQKDNEKMDLLKPDHMACEKHCCSAGSIDSGYQSFPSVESAYTCIEEEGITLYVSNCRYNKDGKLIHMTVGFGMTENSTSSDSLVFDSGLLEGESDSFCESDDESEDFIVFDGDSSCDETDTCFFDSFVFEGTADQVSMAMAMNPCFNSSLEIRITQTVQDSHPCCFPCEENDDNSVVNTLKKQTVYLSKTKDYNPEKQTTNFSKSADSVPKKKNVQFQDKNEVHEMIAWDFAYRQARVGEWKHCATDRLQFQRRIDQTAKIIESVLEKKISQIKN